MANLLAIDLDRRQLHVAAVRTARRAVQVEKVVTWDLPEELTAASADGLGKRLREFLRAAGAGASAAVVALPRDRVILKDVRFPSVASHEEPALVRFQVGKELTDSLEASVVDYAARPGTAGGERQALAVVARRDLVHAVQTLCKSAGLKLLGLAPRPFGIPYTLARIAGADVGTETRAALSLGRDWAELGIFRGADPVLTRSLAVGPTLAAEVRRTLAVHAAQTLDPAGVPARLHVFAHAEAAPEAVEGAVGTEVEWVDPLTTGDDVRSSGGSQGVLAGAIGLAQCWAGRGALPVNLAIQRRVQGPANPTRRKYVLAGAVAGVLLLGGFVAMYTVLARKRAEVQSLTFQKNDLDDALKALAQDRADIDGIKVWENTSIPWVDELYDLSARFPYQHGFRINHLSTEVTAKKGAKDPHVARIRIAGVTPAGQETLVHQLIASVARDGHVRGALEKFKGQEFSLKIDVAKQPRDRYAEVLVAPGRPKGEEPEITEEASAEGGVP